MLTARPSARRVWLAAGALLLGTAALAQQQATPPATAGQATPLPLSGRQSPAGTVNATQTTNPGAQGPNTLTPNLQVAGAFAGSTPAPAPVNGQLSLSEAIARGLNYNLGATQWNNLVRQAQGQSRSARASLMPNLNGALTENAEQTDLKATGFHFNLPAALAASGFSIPTVVGPFNFMELQASLSQTLLNYTELNNYRASQHTLRADQLAFEDARSQVVLGVGGAYLGVIAAQARLDSARAELQTANAILTRSQQQQSVGALPQLTVDQNQVQAAVQQLQLTSLENDLAKQKINLARMIGLSPGAAYAVSDQIAFAPLPDLNLEQALAQALQQRADLQSAEAQVEAARAAAAAARDERLPSASFSGSYGVIGTTPVTNAHGVFNLTATLNVPLWQGGRAAGDQQQAQAALDQRQAEVKDLEGAIEAQVREAFLDVASAAAEVTVAQQNLKTAHEALQMAQDRFEAGVINTVELIQAQQAVATAEQDYIDSVFSHNVAKLTLARALGNAPASWPRFLTVTH